MTSTLQRMDIFTFCWCCYVASFCLHLFAGIHTGEVDDVTRKEYLLVCGRTDFNMINTVQRCGTPMYNMHDTTAVITTYSRSELFALRRQNNRKFLPIIHALGLLKYRGRRGGKSRHHQNSKKSGGGSALSYSDTQPVCL